MAVTNTPIKSIFVPRPRAIAQTVRSSSSVAAGKMLEKRERRPVRRPEAPYD
jgi:hypothetical protein